VTYTWIEHTAELELELRAPDERGVFRAAVAAFAELLGDGSGEPLCHAISLAADDRGAQLVEFLEELVFLADTEGFVPERVAHIDLMTKHAVVKGHVGSPPPLVKAVTYHGLAFAQGADGWLARIVLDV